MKMESGVTSGGVTFATFYGSTELRTSCVIYAETSIVLIFRDDFEVMQLPYECNDSFRSFERVWKRTFSCTRFSVFGETAKKCACKLNNYAI
jgi:hypothetical protein